VSAAFRSFEPSPPKQPESKGTTAAMRTIIAAVLDVVLNRIELFISPSELAIDRQWL
jgi:hypothetical protein